MKKTQTKLLCLTLVVSMLLSLFAIFASAETDNGGEEEDKAGTRVIVNRTFDEGWNYSNGLFDARKNNNYYIDNEILDDFSYNYFMRLEAKNGEDGYAELRFGTIPHGRKHTIVEFDLKLDDYCNLNEILYGRTVGGYGRGATFGMLAIRENNLVVFNDKTKPIPLSNNWTHISFDCDYTDEELYKQNKFKINAIIVPKDGEPVTFTKEITVNGETYMALDIFRFGIPRTDKPQDRVGMSYCLDNVKAYSNDIGFDEIPKDSYGANVDTELDKDITIKNNDGSVEITDKMYLENSICMKVGVDYALFKNKRRPIYKEGYGAPVVVDGNVMVPLEIILEYIGFPFYRHEDGESFDISTGKSATYITIGRNTATVDGQKIKLTSAPGYAHSKDEKPYLVVAMDDIEKLFPGNYVTYDRMGLIIICKKDEILNRETGMSRMLDLMKEFIFEYKTEDEYYNDIVEKTNNFTHPFMMTDQKGFDKLREVYLAEEGSENYNERLKARLKFLVERDAEGCYKTYASATKYDENGKGIEYAEYVGLDKDKIPRNPYPDTLGYDPAGGRLNESGVHCNRIMRMAFAYQISRDERYFECAYDLLLEMGKWEHWGPAHFLNCADASYPYALAIDWLYNFIVERGKTDSKYNVGKLIDILYEHGTYQGYYCTVKTFGQTLWPRLGFQICNYTNMPNNWNAVCVSGMTTSAIITAEKEEYRGVSMELFADNFEKLCRNGLSQYAPDGSYVESPGYWAYGTNALFRMSMIFDSSCGSNYGLMNTWGIDKTCYYACHIESSDYRSFNYHDSGVQPMPTEFFFYVSKALNDPVIGALRMKHLDGGKAPTIFDALYYPDEINDNIELPLSYVMEGIDAFTVRASWEKGSMFAGIIGGYNLASHGQIDSGTWVYHNLDKTWLVDLGSEQYNVYRYFSNDTRYRYYKMNAEGNNCLVMTSQPLDMPYGQNINATGKIVESKSNEFGSYAIVDNYDAYNIVNPKTGGNSVSYAKRGLMSTNKGDTVIIQDEVSLNNIQSFYWFAHYEIKKVKQVQFSPDHRTAYLKDFEDGKTGNVIRLSIVSKVKDFKFELMDCDTFVLKGPLGTAGKDFSTSKGGVAEYSRNGYKKLAIKAENTLSFNLAVAIEVLNQEKEQQVGYEWCEMQNWEPSMFEYEEEHEETGLRETPKKKDIKMGVRDMDILRKKDGLYTEYLDTYFKQLTSTNYAYLKFKDENLDSYKNELEHLENYKNEYGVFIEKSNGYSSEMRTTMFSLFGVQAQKQK